MDGCRLLPMCVVGTASLPLTRGHENVWFSALRATREKWFFALLSAHSTALLAIVGWLWLLSCCCCCCGGPFSEIPVRGAAERARTHTHTRCGKFYTERLSIEKSSSPYSAQQLCPSPVPLYPTVRRNVVPLFFLLWNVRPHCSRDINVPRSNP